MSAMKEVSREEWARRLLEDQLLRLDELRNANPRDAGFKLWRQTTLTVIQRIWPTDLARSERFRRIPFSTPSSKATRTHLKEFYERGCVEASRYLRSLIHELETQGLGEAKGQSAPASEPEAAEAPKLEISDQEMSELEISDLETPGLNPYEPEPGQEPGAEEEPPGLPFELLLPSDVQERKPPKQPLAERLAPPSSAKAAKPPAPPLPAKPPPASPTPPKTASPTPAKPAPPAPAKPAPPAPARPAPAVPRLEDRRALKDMLGFGELRGAPKSPGRPVEQKPGVDPSFAPAGSEYETDPDEVLAEEDLAVEEEPPRAPVPPAPERSGRDLAIQFLNQSPVLSASPKPPSGPRHVQAVAPIEAVRERRPVEPPESTEFTEEAEVEEEGSPAAAALTALAVEVAALGVPAGKRAATRAALLELARGLDQRTATWNSLHDVLSTVLEHPPLARRVVPLLVPYLDLE